MEKTRAEILNAIKPMKTGKAVGPSKVNVEMIAASSQVEGRGGDKATFLKSVG